MTRPVLLAWSGGKDSSLTLAALRADPQFRVVGLLTTVAPAYDRISIHGVRRAILYAQARSLDLPVFEAQLTPGSSNEEYEKAWAATLERARAEVGPVAHVAYGDLFLADVRGFREAQSVRLNYTPLFPIWGIDTGKLAREFIAAGYEAYLTCVDTTQLAPEFVGRRFDTSFLADLPASVDPCGERGEFHTCVTRGPMFSEPIPCAPGIVVERDGFVFADLVLEPAESLR